jgi:YVTN family beta-propeller protein
MFYDTSSCIKRVMVVLVLTLTAIVIGTPARLRTIAQSQESSYRAFEAPQVHPLAITPDGTRLVAVNTPANRLSIFDLTGETPRLVDEIPVGLEPVSVAARSDREVWVANWLSDSVSVVDLGAGNVVRTIDVGDEPTDVTFAGPRRESAFVCVSGLAQVKVYDINALSEPPEVLSIPGKQPRSLAADPAGERVFVSVFESGNQTTVVPAGKVAQAGGPPKPSPKMSKKLPKAPEVGLIVKWNGSRWSDERGDTKWGQNLPYTLADVDLAIIDAAGETAKVVETVRGIGTHVGNVAFDPEANRLYVANTESHNEIRFEPKLSGRFQDSRVSVVSLQGPSPRTNALDLNPHVDRGAPAGSDKERLDSLALPADIVRATDGTVFVAAMGSAKVGVLNSAGALQQRIKVGRGPTGLALDEGRERLYVLNRFDETLSVVNTVTSNEVVQLSVGFNPEPKSVREGRLFLYDARLSAHGDVACASCHLNGHRDGLAWDLGDPKGKMQRSGAVIANNFHPMKGPMTTQSLRGIIGDEPLHWRGDRAKFSDFNPAFMSLLGGPRQLTADEMASFEAFVQTLTYPPNPLQNLDRTYPNPPSGPSAARGQELFTNSRLDAAVLTCNQCHTALPGFRSGTNSVIIPGLLLNESQDFKVPQLRGMYQKVGMSNGPGEQVAGFGFTHDGSVDTLLNFLRVPIFTFRNDDDRRDVEAFLLAFDSGVAPAVGVQVTLPAEDRASQASSSRIALLMQQSDAGNCDLVVKGLFHGERRGFVYLGGGRFRPDRKQDATLSLQELTQAAGTGAELTFTGVPAGTGARLGIDYDSDGVLDGDE